MMNLYARIPCEELQRAVGAAAVDHHDPLRPGQAADRPRNVWHLVEGDQQRGDVVLKSHAMLQISLRLADAPGELSSRPMRP